jgi:predicted ATPase
MMDAMHYLETFQFSQEQVGIPHLYPYNVFRRRDLPCLVFDDITILYGNNASGKSTMLNIIANALRLPGRENGDYNRYAAYFSRFVDECSFVVATDAPRMQPGSPSHGAAAPAAARSARTTTAAAAASAAATTPSAAATSGLPFDETPSTAILPGRYLKSEDLLYEVKKIQQEQILRESHAFSEQLAEQEDRSLAEIERDRQLGSLASPKLELWERIEVEKFSQEKYSNGEMTLQLIDDLIQPGGLYLLDEPETSLSPQGQLLLAERLEQAARYLDCQLIIATHAPLLLGTLHARIYDLDSPIVRERPWTELENVRILFDFFNSNRGLFK